MAQNHDAPEPKRPQHPLLGISNTRLKSLDKGVQKTIESTIKRWLRKRLELLQSLPEDCRLELEQAGLTVPPTLTLPAAQRPGPSAAPAGHRDSPANGWGQGGPGHPERARGRI